MAMPGKTFVSAVREKYEYTKESEGPGGDLVGGEKTGKQQALETLSRVFVGEMEVSDAGTDGEIAAVCGAIEELDLEDFATTDLIDYFEQARRRACIHTHAYTGLPLPRSEHYATVR